jgi:serine/threonine-protein kinase RsbW
VKNHQLDLAVADNLSEIPRIADRVETFCAEAGIPPALCYHINLALEELLTNTISYGFDAKPDRESQDHAIELRIRIEGEEVVIELTDNARPFDPTKASAPDLDASIEDRLVGGLGVYLVKTVMDEVQYRRDGGRNRVTLKKRLPK